MALVLNDRVRETTSVVGTGAVTLLGAVTGFQSFSTIGNSNTTYYCISDQAGVNWEVGIGTYTSSGTTLARTTVLSSSNNGALVVFPAGTKDVFVTYPVETAVYGGGGGTYPTVQPTLNLDFANSKTVDPRITFVRNSTATYYDGQTTAMAEQNLYSGSSPLTYAVLRRTTFPNTLVTAPDGTTTAGQLIDTVTTNTFGLDLGNTYINGATYTLSVFLKKGSLATAPDNVLVGGQASGIGVSGSGVNVNLVTGAINNSYSGITAPAGVSYGNGWFRYSITFTVSGSAGNINSGVCFFTNNTTVTTAPSYLGNGTSDVYIWGAQLEQRSSATAYTPTTTAPITNYIPVLMTAPANVARLDYNPTTGQALGLLIEESRTNLVLQSQFASGFTFVRTTQNINTIIAPDGTLTASKIIPTNVSGSHALYQAVTVASGAPYTWSGYFKAGEYNTIQLNCQASASIYIVTFNLVSGTSTNVSGTGTATITLVGNGWYRCTATATTASTSGFWQFDVRDNSGNTSFTGDGYSGIYIWGAQLEAGAFATSYIPTVASTVTRAVDAASMTGTNFSSWYNQSEWSFYWESNSTVSTVNALVWELYRPAGASFTALGFNNSTTGQAAFSTYGSSNIGQTAGTIVAGSTNKYSATTKPGTGNNILALNGTVQATTASPAWLNVPTGLYFYDINTGGVNWSLNGHIRKLSYYPIALSSSNLVALTS